jgi:hypothetical protein
MATHSAAKDPNAILDFGLDWGDWVSTGDSLSSAVWSVTGPDNALTLSDSSLVGDTATTRAAGGTVGYTYELTCRVNSASGLVDDRSIALQIIEK